MTKLVITIEAEIPDVTGDKQVDLSDVAKTIDSTESVLALLQNVKVSTRVKL